MKPARIICARSRRLLPLVLAVVALASVVPAVAVHLPRDREPPVILVLPPEWGTDDGAPLVRARVTDDSRLADVVLWVRGEYDTEFRPVPMRRAGVEGHQVQLPFWPGLGSRVTYYIEATDRLGNGPRRSGSPVRPFVVDREVAPTVVAATTGLSYPAMLGLFLPPLVVLWVMHRQELRQRERAFWLEVLASSWHKRGRELAESIEDVCARSYRHPRHGRGRLSKLEARRWLERLRV